MTAPVNSRITPEGLVEPVNRYFHIPVAALIVDAIKETRITPNQITYTSVLCGLASAVAFSLGETWSFIMAGVFVEASLILDCADGQLARLKNLATDFGRLLDGIGGYIAYLSMIGGMMIGMQNLFGVLLVLTGVTVLRAIAFDYFKLSMGAIINEGIDGSKRDIRKAYLKIRLETPSILFKTYFYYLQFQRLIFNGQWSSLQEYSQNNEKASGETRLTEEQRKIYYQKIKTLLAAWKWNGHEMVLFLIAFFSIIGIIESALTALTALAGTQFCLIFIFHHYFIRHEIRS